MRQPARGQLLGGGVDPVDGRLSGEPLDELGHAVLQLDPRLVAEELAGEGDVREAVADVADPVAAGRLRGDVDAHHRRQPHGELEDGDARAAADVQHPTVRGGGVERERERLGDVVDRDEVAALEPVLEDQRRPPVQEARGEDREHSGVRVRQRLARAVGVEEAQGDGGHAVRRAEEQAEPLLLELRERVDRGELRLLRLGRRRGAGGRLPVAALELLARPRRAGALAVDAHARGDEELADGPLGERLAEHRRPELVGRGVLGRLVHALADADARGEVDDRVACRPARGPPCPRRGRRRRRAPPRGSGSRAACRPRAPAR